MKNIPLCWILLLCIISFEKGFCAIPDAGHLHLKLLEENSSSDIHFSRESIVYCNEVWGTGGYPDLHPLIPYQLHIINNSTLDSLEVIRPGNDKNRFKTNAVEGNYFFTFKDPIGCSSGGYDNFNLVQPEVKVYSRFDYAYRGDIRCMPVYVDNFFDLEKFNIGMDWDENQLRLSDVKNIHPLLTQGQLSIDTTQADNGRMKMTWTDSLNYKLPPGTRLFDLCFRVLANQGTRALISFNEYGTYFNNGNFDLEWSGKEGTIFVYPPSSVVMRNYSYCYTEKDKVQITVNILGDDPPYIFEITEAGIVKSGINQNQFTIPDLPTGTYSYRVTHQDNGTEYSKNAIEIPPGTPIDLSVEEIVFPECEAEKGIIKLQAIDQDIEYIHVTGPGLDEYYQQKTLFENLDAGTYTFTAGEVNGCTSDTLSVELEGKSSLDISVDQTASSCDSGSSKPKIIILNADRDTVITNFTLDYRQVFAANMSIDITPGLHTVEVMHPDYCSLTKEITVQEAGSSGVFIERQDENQNIKKGKPFTLLANYTTSTGFDTWQWTPSGQIQSSSMNEATFKVDSSLWIHLQATDISGCTIKDSLFILITEGQPSEDITYYIPNAFTPNGDDINDRLEFFTKDTRLSVEEVRIFDRYGNNLFTNNGPFSNSELWDGKSQQSLVPPGVYVLTISIRKGDNTLELLTTDITVIR